MLSTTVQEKYKATLFVARWWQPSFDQATINSLIDLDIHLDNLLHKQPKPCTDVDLLHQTECWREREGENESGDIESSYVSTAGYQPHKFV